MAAQARFDDSEAMGTLRGVAAKLRDHPRTNSAFARLAFFCQPEPLNLSMAERLTRTDRQFGPIFETAFRHTLHLLTNATFESIPQAIEAAGESRSRRIFATVAYGWWANFGLAKVGVRPILAIQQAAAIGHIMSSLANPSKGEDRDARFAMGLVSKIGVPLMALTFGDRYVSMLSQIEHSERRLQEHEFERFGVTHGDAARALMESLNAHESLIDAVVQMHRPLQALKDVPQRLSLAETTALHLGYDAGMATARPELPTTMLIRLGLPAINVGEVADEVAKEAALAACYFGA